MRVGLPDYISNHSKPLIYGVLARWEKRIVRIRVIFLVQHGGADLPRFPSPTCVRGSHVPGYGAIVG